MNAMMDGRCPKCSKRFGWRGKVTERPPCPRCGHQLPREQLEKDQATLERALTALERPSFCGKPGHTEADVCQGDVAGAKGERSTWCGACAWESRR